MNLILGTMTFGESVFLPEVKEFIDTFLRAGYHELDTAYVYNDGICEKILGEVLPSLSLPYEIATKVNPRISGKLDAEAAYKQVNESLTRMNLKSVDTVFLHFPDPKTPIESVLSAMANLHEQGKFKKLGVSNFPAWMVADAYHICEKHGWVTPSVFEGVYNPLTRKAEVELNDCLNNFGMKFYAYNPLAGGLLTGRYTSFGESPKEGRFTNRPNYQKRYWKKSFFEAVKFLKDACELHGISLIEGSYRWMAYHSMLNDDRGDAIIVGASKLNHLKQNLDSVKSGPLPQDLVNVFETVWDITRGDSPEYFTLYKGKGSVGGENK